MAGMLSPMDIQGIMQNSMLNPLTQASMDMPYPEQAMTPPPPNPTAPMAGGQGMPPMPTAMQNEMIPPEIPQMPQAQAVNQMFQSEQVAPIPQQMPQDPMGKWGPAMNVLGQFAAQIDDAQARANLPADLYLKMKQQTVEAENANQDRLLKNLQMEADVKYRQQSLELEKEKLAIQRAEMMGNLTYKNLQTEALQRQLGQPSLPSGVDIPEGYMPKYDETGMFVGVDRLSGLPKGPEVTEDVAKLEGDIRKEFDSLTKPYREVRDAYTRITAAAKNPSAAGDLALIFNYMKMLDPGSTVREGEFANAQNAGGIPDIVRAQYNKIKNGQRLADAQRGDFVTRAEMLYQGMEQSYNSDKARYEQTVAQYGLNQNGY